MSGKNLARPTLALVSLGCAKNAADLQILAGDFVKSRGYALSADPDRADTVIVNTCSFIASARVEAEAEIRRALALKANGNYNRVIVAGCYPQRYPDAAAKFPGVDVWQGVPDSWRKPPVPGLRLTGKAFAYLKIAEGCSHRCSYCAIPSIRGKFRSRPLKDIVGEAKALLDTGCRELDIVAQDPMMYGADIKSRDVDLMKLLWELEKIPGKFWVRVLYSYPSEITADFADWLNFSSKAVKYVDVPLQHTVPEILAKMNRRRAIAASLDIAFLLREAVDGITLRTTVMTGFPGETQARFDRMRSDLRRMQFDRLGAFAYSPEKGTKAYLMRSRPSRKVAEEREKIVMKDAFDLWRTRSARMIGSVHEALVVAPGIARLSSQAPDVDGVVRFKGEADVGSFAKIRLSGADNFDFTGRIA